MPVPGMQENYHKPGFQGTNGRVVRYTLGLLPSRGETKVTNWRKFTEEQLLEIHRMTRVHWKNTGKGYDKLEAIEQEIYRRLDEQD